MRAVFGFIGCNGFMISIVIPLYNEARNVPILLERIGAAMAKLGTDYEVLCVNDGSTDTTEDAAREVAQKDARVKLINLRRNTGQTAAMMAGIDHSRGHVIVPMDGDLQNDPNDIGVLLAKLDEGFDVVSGWRQDRKDARFSRTLPSRIANGLISAISGVHLHDYGCSLKAYRREVIAGVRLYGEMHRFIPIYASWQGGRVAEIPVSHHPRVHGVSNYGLERLFKVLLDLLVVQFLGNYNTKPIYIFGAASLACFALAFGSGLYAVWLKLFEGISFILTPLPLLVAITFLTGLMCFLLGLLAEVLTRVYFESQGKTTYLVRDTVNIGSAPTSARG